MPAEVPGKIRHDDDGTLEHTDEQQVATFVVVLDLGGDLAEPMLDVRLGQEHLGQIGADVVRVHVPQLPQSGAFRRRSVHRGDA